MWVLTLLAVTAVSRDWEAASGMPPTSWNKLLRPLALGALYQMEVYGRAKLYGDSYVTSASYQKQQTRDNQWICFQHHVHG